MSHIIRSIVERLRGKSRSSGPSDDQRVAPRFRERREMRLLFSVTVQEVRSAASAPPLVVRGHTRDISRTGMALALPSLHAGERDLTKGERPLLMELELPSGTIRFQAKPVRFEEPDRQEDLALLGVHITNIGKDARARLDQFLREAQRQQPVRSG